MRFRKDHEKIIEFCKTALTFTEVENRLGLTSPQGGLRKYIKLHSIPMPCFLGQHAGCMLQKSRKRKVTLTSLSTNSFISTGCVKRLLIRENIKKEECEKCGWKERCNDGKCPIHLHHINGNSSDNRLKNLQLLCPNCHSLTSNYAGRNRNNPRRQREFKARKAYFTMPCIECKICGKLGYGKIYCSPRCKGIGERTCDRPSIEILTKEINTMSWTAIGKKYGVSDNAIRKWAKNYGLKF